MTRYIQRHSLLTRVTHGVAAIACILLAFTGLFVFVPSLGGGIMGGDFTYAMRMLHRVPVSYTHLTLPTKLEV